MNYLNFLRIITHISGHAQCGYNKSYKAKQNKQYFLHSSIFLFPLINLGLTESKSPHGDHIFLPDQDKTRIFLEGSHTNHSCKA